MSADEAFSTSRFYVVIDNVAQAFFTEVSGLQVETETYEYAEGGNNAFIHRLPGRTKTNNITLKRGVTSSNELLKWCLQNVQGKITRRNISVVMYNTAGVEVMRWDFVNAYPVRWVGPTFTADGNQNAVESLELAHTGIQLGK